MTAAAEPLLASVSTACAAGQQSPTAARRLLGSSPDTPGILEQAQAWPIRGSSGGSSCCHADAPLPPEQAQHAAAAAAAQGAASVWRSSEPPLQHALSADILPPRLRALLVDPSAVEFVPGPQGRLGRGAR